MTHTEVSVVLERPAELHGREVTEVWTVTAVPDDPDAGVPDIVETPAEQGVKAQVKAVEDSSTSRSTVYTIKDAEPIPDPVLERAAEKMSDAASIARAEAEE